ncbi:uncharacterized protein LOC112194420 [Rosa chinensis]|uniref:uncharacterized protein LOC112194420 n=1 Tax=Rosa chinensis TaxID=74649 RepID=UPI000D097D11|nr:uncharacterized protein LOC112194420 [Rosa chinensis]
MVKGILPTKVAIARRVDLPYMNCDFCFNVIEDGIHLFRDCEPKCEVTGGLWLLSSLGLNAKDVPGSCLEEWVLNVFNALHGGQCEAFFMYLWVIWMERNTVIWKGTCFIACIAGQWASQLLLDYQKLHMAGLTKKTRIKAKWQLPPTGRLKINVDGSYRPEFGDGGIGIVVRDEDGICIATMAHYFPHVISATHMEAEACRAGVLLAIHQYWDAFDFETDCSLVVVALQQNVEDRSDIGRIIDDCKSYLTSFHSIQIRYIFRKVNGVAHRLAHLGSLNYLDDI